MGECLRNLLEAFSVWHGKVHTFGPKEGIQWWMKVSCMFSLFMHLKLLHLG